MQFLFYFQCYTDKNVCIHSVICCTIFTLVLTDSLLFQCVSLLFLKLLCYFTRHVVKKYKYFFPPSSLLFLPTTTGSTDFFRLDGTAAHHAAIHCLRRRTVGPTVLPADIPPLQSSTLSLRLIGTVRAEHVTVSSRAWVQSPDPAE